MNAPLHSGSATSTRSARAGVSLMYFWALVRQLLLLEFVEGQEGVADDVGVLVGLQDGLQSRDQLGVLDKVGGNLVEFGHRHHRRFLDVGVIVAEGVHERLHQVLVEVAHPETPHGPDGHGADD